VKIKYGEYLVEATKPVGDWNLYKLGTKEDKEKQTQEETQTRLSSHGKLHQAMLNLLNQKLHQNTATDAKAVVRVIREEAQGIKDICERIEELFKQALAKEGATDG